MNKGISLAFITVLISGFAVFFNKFAVGFWQNSSVFTTGKNLVAVFFLTSLIVLFKKRTELKKLTKKQWSLLIFIGFIGGSVPFLLFFKGLTLTSAINAAFIHKTLFVWVAFLAVPFLKEKISVLQWLALAILLLGVYLFSSLADFKIGYGEFLIFAATLMWAVENIIAKRVLENMHALIVGWGRMFFGSVFLLLFLAFTGNFTGIFGGISAQEIGWLIFSGFLLFGYVITWYSSLKRAPAVVVSSVLVLAAPITAFLNSLFVTHQFKVFFLAPTILMLSGVFFVSKLYERFTVFRQVRSTA